LLSSFRKNTRRFTVKKKMICQKKGCGGTISGEGKTVKLSENKCAIVVYLCEVCGAMYVENPNPDFDNLLLLTEEAQCARC
jgi:hypothetical protein